MSFCCIELWVDIRLILPMLGGIVEVGIDQLKIIWKGEIWAHFWFYSLAGKHALDETHVVCKIVPTAVTNHVSYFHLKLTSGVIKNRVGSENQPRIEEALPTLPSNSEKGVCSSHVCDVYHIQCPVLELACDNNTHEKHCRWTSVLFL